MQLKKVLEWFSTCVLVGILLWVYALNSGYVFTDVVSTVIPETAALVLYTFTILLWTAFVMETLTKRMVLFSCALALFLWHTSLWGEANLLAIELFSEGYNGTNPHIQVFDKQSAVAYCFLFGWLLVGVKGYRLKRVELKFLSIAGAMLFFVIAGHHIIAYWSLYKLPTSIVEQNDQIELLKLASSSDEVFNRLCTKLVDISCFRFDATGNYPPELLSFNTGYTEYIREFSKIPEAKLTYFSHSAFIRDVLFENNFSNYYNRSIQFHQSNGVATYIIVGNHVDVPDSIMVMIGHVGLIASLFWVGIFVGIGYAHKSAFHSLNRVPQFDIVRLIFTMVTTLVVSPLVAWIGLDFLIKEFPLIGVAILLVAIYTLLKARMYTTLGVAIFLIVALLPAVSHYTITVQKALSGLDSDILLDGSFEALLITLATTSSLVALILGVSPNVRNNVQPEFVVLCLVFVLTTSLGTSAAIGFGFIDSLMEADIVRNLRTRDVADSLRGACSGFILDQCKDMFAITRVDFSLTMAAWLNMLTCITAFTGTLFIGLAVGHPVTPRSRRAALSRELSNQKL